MKRTVLATFLGALVLSAWHLVFWAAVPLHRSAYKEWTGTPEALESFLLNFPGSGVYRHPGFDADRDAQRLLYERAKSKPVANLIVVHKKGWEFNAKWQYAAGFVANALCCLLASLILLSARVGMLNIGRRFLIVFLLGLFASAVHYLPAWVWQGFSKEYCAVHITQVAVGWAAAAIVIASVFVRPRARATNEAAA